MPPILVYLTEGATAWGSGIEQIIDGFYKFGLRPYLERIEESIRIHLLPREEWDDYEFEFRPKTCSELLIFHESLRTKTEF